MLLILLYVYFMFMSHAFIRPGWILFVYINFETFAIVFQTKNGGENFNNK